MIRKVVTAQVIRVPRVFEESGKETHFSLISTHPMWRKLTDQNFQIEKDPAKNSRSSGVTSSSRAAPE